MSLASPGVWSDNWPPTKSKAKKKVFMWKSTTREDMRQLSCASWPKTGYFFKQRCLSK